MFCKSCSCDDILKNQSLPSQIKIRNSTITDTNESMSAIQSILYHDNKDHAYHWESGIEYYYTIYTNNVDLGSSNILNIDGTIEPIQTNGNLIQEIKKAVDSLKNIISIQFKFREISELMNEYNVSNVMDLFIRLPTNEKKNERGIIFTINQINNNSTLAGWNATDYNLKLSSLIALVPDLTLDSNNNINQFGIQTLYHEIGHALGLKHPHESSNFNNNILNQNLDQIPYTVMTYEMYRSFTNFIGLSSYNIPQMTVRWGIIDMLALQYTYGIPQLENNTDNTYKIQPNNDCIWLYIHDTKGINTIDGSEIDNKYLVIDLRKPDLNNSNTGSQPSGSNIIYSNPESFLEQFWTQKNYVSFAVDFVNAEPFLSGQMLENYSHYKLAAYTNGYIISDKTKIQNAIGGGNDDIIIANEEDNKLYGGKGNDSFFINCTDNYSDSNINYEDYIYGDEGNNDVTILNLDANIDETELKKSISYDKNKELMLLKLKDNIKIFMKDVNTIRFANMTSDSNSIISTESSNTISDASDLKSIDLTILKNELTSSAMGDPYIIPLDGSPVWKMANFDGFSRMFQGFINHKQVTINVQTTFNTDEENYESKAFAIKGLQDIGLDESTIEKSYDFSTTNETFMRQLWIKFGTKETYINMNLLSVSNLKDFIVKKTNSHIKFPNYDCHEAESILIQLDDHDDDISIIVSKFNNPQIKTGFKFMCNNCLIHSTTGALCNRLYQEDMEIDRINNTEPIQINYDREPKYLLEEKYWTSNKKESLHTVQIY